MKIRYMSDLHIEFEEIKIGKMEGEEEQVLVLAGDIAPITPAYQDIFLTLLNDVTSRFKAVIHVCGNHEYYRTRIDKAERILMEYQDEYENFHFLQNDYRTIDDVTFIGATLWTDMSGNDLTVSQLAKSMMNDYRVITKKDGSNFRKLDPVDTISIHHQSKNYIFGSLEPDFDKTVVVTHHAPSFQSIGESFKGSPLNGAYATDLEEKIEEIGPDIWIHGHIHNTVDYTIGKTNVLTNPRGYAKFTVPENRSFLDTKIIEL